ncbi:MAG TPA: hypothetical protein VM935_20580 [Chitinophagaceae bacterium]|nr:hypothetical protein [Chitinophagaceae bacterium]
MAKTIKILKGFPNGTLELSDRGHTKAKKGNAIKWKIRDRSDKHSIEVASIECIELKEGSDDIFSSSPHRDGDTWKATIDRTAAAYDASDYAIKWKDCKGNEYTHDPKISVLPSDNVFREVALVAMAVVATVALCFLFNKKRKFDL